MNPDRAPLTDAALADALTIMSRGPAFDPPLYICNRELCASAMQTFIPGLPHTTSDPNTFWTREEGGVYDYTSGNVILRRRGIISGSDILAGEHCTLVVQSPHDTDAEYNLRGDMAIGLARSEGYLHARAVWIYDDNGIWEYPVELATCTCDLCMSWQSARALRILTMM
jgi:hypothetical protein